MQQSNTVSDRAKTLILNCSDFSHFFLLWDYNYGTVLTFKCKYSNSIAISKHLNSWEIRISLQQKGVSFHFTCTILLDWLNIFRQYCTTLLSQALFITNPNILSVLTSVLSGGCNIYNYTLRENILCFILRWKLSRSLIIP